MLTEPFAVQLAANDLEHVERLEAIADEMAKTASESTVGVMLTRRWERAIRDELARWKRTHPMEGA